MGNDTTATEAIIKYPAKLGYTLIEALIVIGLLGIIFAIVAPIYTQTWRVAKNNANPLPLNKLMLAMHEMDLHARYSEKIALVRYNGTPSMSSPEIVTWDAGTAQGIAFQTPITTMSTMVTTKKWVSYQISEHGIWRYEWAEGGNPEITEMYKDTLRDIYQSEITREIWRGVKDDAAGYPGIMVYGQNVRLLTSEINVCIPFAVSIEKLR